MERTIRESQSLPRYRQRGFRGEVVGGEGRGTLTEIENYTSEGFHATNAGFQDFSFRSLFSSLA